MSEDIVKNNPKKELMFTLVGIALFLGIVLLIGISAWLRPAGEHITAEPTEESVAADEAVVIAKEDAAPAEADTVEAVAPVTAAATTPDTAADAMVTPAPSTGDAIITAEAGTATAEGTVNQAAVGDADLTAEQADGDLDGATVVAE
ncbi:hypothetical protein [Psychrobacter sp. 72-O-c]|uniref:hypothetical protein n=1 Tax=Psychrobacter sp. 72-O-c TaxID=2774125 RepID=UPI00191A1D41|nr:hypothetical protein [Psychrobacter sp. 72-O-c]